VRKNFSESPVLPIHLNLTTSFAFSVSSLEKPFLLLVFVFSLELILP
jgi:hypothetical protein